MTEAQADPLDLDAIRRHEIERCVPLGEGEIGEYDYQYRTITALVSEMRELRGENERLTGLLSRVAGPAVNYDSRVYHLTDDFQSLVPYLSEEQVTRAGERPCDTAARTAVERDERQAALDRVTALHRPVTVQTGSKTHGGDPEYGEICGRDREAYPCETVRAAVTGEGEQQG